jgi:hypothetical protein
MCDQRDTSRLANASGAPWPECFRVLATASLTSSRPLATSASPTTRDREDFRPGEDFRALSPPEVFAAPKVFALMGLVGQPGTPSAPARRQEPASPVRSPVNRDGLTKTVVKSLTIRAGSSQILGHRERGAAAA